ncbi:MAG TPA: LCP family protein [bacterium]|nr:LCP family protein [bacterium]
MKRPELERRHLLMLAIALGAVLLVCAATLLFGNGWRFWREGPDDLIAAKQPVVVLLNALDEERKLAGCALLLYDAGSQRTVLLGVPTTAVLPGADSQPHRLSALRDEGVGAQSAALARLCGLAIPFYLEIDSEEFYRLADVLGGIEVRLDRQLTATVRGEQLMLPIERYRYNSDKLREYVRYADALESPAERQDLMQRLLTGLVLQFKLQRDLLANPEVWGLIGDWLQSNLTVAEIGQLANRVADCGADNLQWQMLPGSAEISNGVAMFVPRAPELATLLAVTPAAPAEEAPVPEPESAPAALTPLKTALLNGTGVGGVAHGLRQQLAEHRDVDIVEVGNADNFNYRQTKIVARTGNLPAAQRVREYLGFGQATTDGAASDLMDVTIIVGRDYLERRNQ